MPFSTRTTSLLKKDNFLNEDEQILVFSAIKHRIAIIAEELIFFKKYEIYKDLMAEVRTIEKLINKYQNYLRANLHKRELDEYLDMGREITHDFNEKWGKRMTQKETLAQCDVQQLEQKIDSVLTDKFIREQGNINEMKVKRSNRIRLLENQERLVAINERIEEAANFRNEIRKAKRYEESQLDKEKEWMMKNLRRNLSNEKKKEMKKKKDRLDLERFNMEIAKNKETDIMSKKINLHVKDIERIQNGIVNFYSEKGKKSDELRREKERQSNTNKTIAAFKSIKKYSVSSLATSKHDLVLALLLIPTKNTFAVSTDSLSSNKSVTTKKNLQALKFIIRNLKITKFDIASDYRSKLYCNVSTTNKNKDDNNMKFKIEKLLSQRKHKDEIFIHPSQYYDEQLNEVYRAEDHKKIKEYLKEKNQTLI